MPLRSLSYERAIQLRETQIALFREIVSAISRRLDLERTLALIAEHARVLIQAESLLIPVLDADASTYTYRAGSGKDTAEIVGESLPIDYGICGWVWRNKRAWWRGVLDTLSDSERQRWQDRAGNVILVPLEGRYGFLGGIAGIGKLGGGDFDETDLAMLSMLADWVVVAIDNSQLIDQLAQTNTTLQEQKERVQTTLASIGDAVITTDREAMVDYLNPAAERLLDIRSDEVIGQPLKTLLALSDQATGLPSDDPVATCLRGEPPPRASGIHTLMRPDGRLLYVECTAAAVRRDRDAITGAVVVLHDVTETHELSVRIAHQASHDALTDLINRREFEVRLARVLAAAQEQDSEHALLYIDLDQFKVVNDTCGHVAGDELLRQVSAELGTVIRRGDTLARLGGDEFGVLLEDCPREQALRIAQGLLQTIEALRFSWMENRFRVTASIGVVILGRHSPPLAKVLSIVDAACYIAKDQGRNRVYVHDEHDDELLRRHGEMQWAPRIAEAIEKNRLVLYQQRITPVAGSDGGGLHYEILVRMHDAQGALVPPGAFLPAAERYNLIASIDKWVLNSVLTRLAASPRHLERLSLCGINLSGHSLGNDQLLPYIEQQLRERGVPAHKLCFEITETEAIANLSRAREFITRLRALGCRFALDDFGSGFSSYAYLKNLPVDFLKIDGVFVRDLAVDRVSRAMVESINHIGHVMGKQTIAEFVEDKAAIGLLREIGVDYAQGYGVATPMPFDQLLRTTGG